MSNKTIHLSDVNKIKIPDCIDAESKAKAKKLKIVFDGSASAKKINNRLYSYEGQRDNVHTWTKPYKKPLLEHHNLEKDAIGRVTKVEFVDLSNEAINFFPSPKDFEEFKAIERTGSASEIVAALKKYNLLDNAQWPGLSKLRFEAIVSDKEAIEKFIDERYLTFSVRTTTDSYTCAKCNKDYMKGGVCKHLPYMADENGNPFIHRTKGFFAKEVSTVNNPAYKNSVLESIAFVDSEESKDEEGNILPQECHSIMDTESASFIDGEITIIDNENDTDSLSDNESLSNENANENQSPVNTTVNENVTSKSIEDALDAAMLKMQSFFTSKIEEILGRNKETSDKEYEEKHIQSQKLIESKDNELSNLRKDYESALVRIQELTDENKKAKNNENALDSKANEGNHKDDENNNKLKVIESPSIAGATDSKIEKNYNKLGSFEKGIVDKYKAIKDSSGDEVANAFLARKKMLKHIPPNFNIKDHICE